MSLNWQSDLVDKDHQQDAPSLTFARPEQIAKSLVVDQELLQCWLQFTSTMFITKYSSLIQISQHFIHPFSLIPVGLIAFPSLGWLQDRTVFTELLIIHPLINHLSGGFMNFVKQM